MKHKDRKETKHAQYRSRKRRRPTAPTPQGSLAQSEEPDRLDMQRAASRPDLASQADVLALQRSYGNRAVAEIMAGEKMNAAREARAGETAKVESVKEVAASLAAPLVQRAPEEVEGGIINTRPFSRNENPSNIAVEVFKKSGGSSKIQEWQEISAHTKQAIVESKKRRKVEVEGKEYTNCNIVKYDDSSVTFEQDIVEFSETEEEQASGESPFEWIPWKTGQSAEIRSIPGSDETTGEAHFWFSLDDSNTAISQGCEKAAILQAGHERVGEGVASTLPERRKKVEQEYGTWSVDRGDKDVTPYFGLKEGEAEDSEKGEPWTPEGKKGWIKDTPSPAATGFSEDFVAAIVCIEGPAKGTVYGTWEWRYVSKGNEPVLCNVTKAYSYVTQVPAKLKAAAKGWNLTIPIPEKQRQAQTAAPRLRPPIIR